MQDKIIKTELDRVLNVPGMIAGSGNQVATVVVANSPGTTGAAPQDGAEASGSAQSSLAEAIAVSTAQLAEVRASIEGQLASLTENTRAVTENTTSKSVGSVASGVAGSMLNTVLGGGLLGPIVSGLMDLFGGGDSSAETTVTKFALPTAVSFAAGLQNGLMSGVDYGSGGVPRAIGSSDSATAQQITVNVSAMDSRSFLDHSNDIANAVRKAMLVSSALNDVIGDM